MSEGKQINKKYKGGRKRVADLAVFRYGIKLTSVENVKFEAMFLKSGLFEKSKFIKNMIFSRRMKVVKALKTNFGDKRALVLINKLEKETMKPVAYSQEILRLSKEFEVKYLAIEDENS